MPARRRPNVPEDRVRRALRPLLLAALLCAPAFADAASCVCADRDGCTTPPACADAVPGDACSPDGRSACRITLGSSADPTCCCTCGRGPGPRSCVFAPVIGRANGALGALDCGRAATRAMTAALEDLALRLGRAERACRDGSRQASRLVNGARRRLERLRRKLVKLVERGKATAECAARLGSAVDALDADVDDIAARGMPGGGTPVTTTTLPGSAVWCQGTLARAGGFALDVAFTCPGGPGVFTAFGIRVPSRHQITAFTPPSGFTCEIRTWTTPNDYWSCTGAFAPGTPVDGGRLVLDPAPSAGIAASLWVLQGPARFGAFSLLDAG
ncbi:MAG: hypothetical protein KIT14_21805 [bacterium]|nr:hypothetical protein [bacterium]